MEWIIYVQAQSQDISVKGASAKSDDPDDRRLWLMSRKVIWTFLYTIPSNL